MSDVFLTITALATVAVYISVILTPFIWLTWLVKYVVHTWRDTVLEINKK